MYKRIAGAEDEAALQDVQAELKDRYGDPPDSVSNLIAAAQLRLLCERLGIAQLDRKRTQIELPNPNGNRKQPLKEFVEMLHIRFAAEAADTSQHSSDADRRHVDPNAIMTLVARNAKRGAQFTPQGLLRWPLTSAKASHVLLETRTLLESLSSTT